MRFFVLLILSSLCVYAFWFDSPKPKTIEIKAPPMDVAYEKSMALDYLNTLRQETGMSRYITNKILQKAAMTHANYLIQNHKLGHFEKEGARGFTGETPKQRALQAGYQVGMITENVSVNVLDYKDSIDELFSAIYHRFGFLDFQSDEIGIGIVQNPKDTNQNAFVYDMGIYELDDLCTQRSYDGDEKYVYHICKNPNHRIEEQTFHSLFQLRKSASKKLIIYPYDKQDNVPPAFYNESPDPLPEYDVSGFPISIQFNDYYFKHSRLTTFALYTMDDEEIPAKVLDVKNDPNHMFKPNQYALFPYKRLDYDTPYKVVVTYRADGKNATKEWHFRTKKLPKPFFIITKNQAHIKIKPHTLYTLYFKPVDSHDLLKDLHFPADVEIRFLDQNTITLKLTSNNTESFEVKSGVKTLHVEIDTP